MTDLRKCVLSKCVSVFSGLRTSSRINKLQPLRSYCYLTPVTTEPRKKLYYILIAAYSYASCKNFPMCPHVSHMSCTCLAHVLHMSLTCLSHVSHMSCTCLSHVLHMSCTCLSHVLHMSCTCLSHVLHMSCVPIAGSRVVMGVTWQTTHLRRVCVRTVTPCVSSAWVPGQGTAPRAEMQG